MHAPRWLSAALLVLTSPLSLAAAIAPTKNDVVVSSETSGIRQRPSVTANGPSFIVVWEDTRAGVDGVHVRGRGMDEQGALLGTEFQVDGDGTQWSQGPSIVPNHEGEFAMVWRSDAKSGGRPQILAQRIDATGTKIGGHFQVNTPRALDGDYYLGEPSAAPVPDGGFVVVWSSGILSRAVMCTGRSRRSAQDASFRTDSPSVSTKS